jgi:hypothetical protein
LTRSLLAQGKELTAVGALALIFALAHVPFLAPSLEDIDSVNFALGVRDFDVATHRPHPPGYPVYIALGKIATAIAGALSSAPASTIEATLARSRSLACIASSRRSPVMSAGPESRPSGSISRRLRRLRSPSRARCSGISACGR